MRIALEPDAERSCEEVVAMAKMSDGCALSIVCKVRYCLDCTWLMGLVEEDELRKYHGG